MRIVRARLRRSGNVSGTYLAVEYRREIDGLRALAIVPVVMFHAGFPGFSGGFVGVDVFFVISGFLITSILLSHLEEGRLSIAEFYERRARRILPALFFVLLVCMVPAWFLLSPGELASYGESLVAVPLFLSNFQFWLDSGYFAPVSEEVPLLHTWSLAVEEQYYLLFPLLLAALWTRGRVIVLIGLVGIALISLPLSQWGSHAAPNATFFLLPTRLWELLLGAVGALVHRYQWGGLTASRGAMEVVSVAGLVALGFAIVAFDKSTPFPGFAALVPTLGTLAILLFADRHTLVGGVLGRRELVGIGLISYSAYLWHQPMFAFARIHAAHDLSHSVFAVLAVGAFGLGFLSWRFVERPFRDRRFLSRSQIFGASVLVSALFIVLGSIAVIGKGLDFRLSDESRVRYATIEHSPERETCHTKGVDYLAPEDACVYFGDVSDWAVVGDSHMVEFAHALALELERENSGLVHLTFSGCPPALDFEATTPGCSEWTRDVVSFLERSPNLTNVVLGYRHSRHLFGENRGKYPELPNARPRLKADGEPEALREVYWRSFQHMIERLLANDKQVYVVMPIPELTVDVSDYLIAPDGLTKIPGETREYYLRRNEYVLTKFALLPWGDNLRRIDPTASLCDDLNCFAFREGKAMYFDNHHLSLTGADRLVESEFASFLSDADESEIERESGPGHIR